MTELKKSKIYYNFMSSKCRLLCVIIYMFDSTSPNCSRLEVRHVVLVHFLRCFCRQKEKLNALQEEFISPSINAVLDHGDALTSYSKTGQSHIVQSGPQCFLLPVKIVLYITSEGGNVF